MLQLLILVRTIRKSNVIKCFSFVLLVLLLALNSEAKNYYISSSSGNDSYNGTQAQNPETPWRSIAKLNSVFYSIVAGDNIYFKRGDSFFGTIVFTNSGTSGNLITISAYGTGNKPVITGLITLSSWSSVGNGIYQSSAPAVKNTVNLVTLNGTPQAVGRFPNVDAPNRGFLSYESYSGTTSITDNQMSIATNWEGAEVVIRKQHYVMDKSKIIKQTSNTLYYNPVNPFYTSLTPTPVIGTNGYDYFIQRDPRTLDELGEWYFNTSTKNLQMYFGSTSPSAYAIKVTTLDTLININNQSYINVNNISFEGANVAAVYAKDGAGNLTITDCDIKTMGCKGIYVFNAPNILINNITTNNILCNAIDVTDRQVANVKITNCNISNTALLAGMGSFWDDNDYKSISSTVSSGLTIQSNNIINSGYVGIQFQGNNVLIKNNYVNNYDLVKDDGGGIYTFASNNGPTYQNRVISGNIILNGVGAIAFAGGGVDVDGIFLDGSTMNVDVLNNSIANIGENGIYSNNSSNVTIRGNTSYNNGCGMSIGRYSYAVINNLNVKQNIFYPKTLLQNNFGYGDGGLNLPVPKTLQQAFQTLGNIDSNYYAIPNAAGFIYTYQAVSGGSTSFPAPLTYEGWKSFSGHDAASKSPSYNLAYYKVNSIINTNTINNGQFTSNMSGINAWSNNIISATWDNTGKITGPGSLKITPLISKPDHTLLYGPLGSITSTKKYLLRFTTLGSSNSGVLRTYLRQTQSPQASLTPAQLSTFSTTKKTHEFLFTAPTSEATASFMIEIQQNFGTIYIDDISFTEVDATILNIDDQLRFEYNATNADKTISLGAKYIGVDSTVFDGTITLAPYTSKILYKAGSASITPPLPPQTLIASASSGTINCFGNTTTINVTGTGGKAPYAGTGSYTVNAGLGTLKITVPKPSANAATFLYSNIGSVSSAKYYILRFSTVGTSNNGSLTAAIRQTYVPWANLTSEQSATFGTSRVDHEFYFKSPASDNNASFIIQLDQSSGTTYIDNIAFFESDATKALISTNLYSGGQFENGISNISSWSINGNHIATWDVTGKISNTYYYPVKDAAGLISTATLLTSQPSAPLSSTASAPYVTVSGGSVSIMVAAAGGTAPYTGTGTFPNAKVGHYTYNISDANGCTSVADIIVQLNTTASRLVAGSTNNLSFTAAATLNSIESVESNLLKISAYPNPTSTEFSLMVQGVSSEIVNISVSSVDGRIVYTAQGASNKKYLFGNNFMPGMYIIQVVQGKNVQTLKAIKIK